MPNHLAKSTTNKKFYYFRPQMTCEEFEQFAPKEYNLFVGSDFWISWDVNSLEFCLIAGRIVVYEKGEDETWYFDPSTESWEKMSDMDCQDSFCQRRLADPIF